MERNSRKAVVIIHPSRAQAVPTNVFTDPSHILFGGDYPYTPAPFVKNNIEKFKNYEPIRPYLEDIFRNNAIKLFELAK